MALAVAPTVPTPRTGDIYYDTALAAIRFYDGAAWNTVGGSGSTPATTVTSETTYAISAAVGSSLLYARQDHTHGSPATPVTTLAVTNNASVNASTGAVTITNSLTPTFTSATIPSLSGNVSVGGTFSSTGFLNENGVRVYSATNPNLSITTPAAIATAGTVGVGTTFARADHVHAGVATLTGTALQIGVSASTGAVTLTNLGYHSANANLSSTTPAAIALTGTVGVGTTFARADHVHQGVLSITGTAAQVTASASAGALTLSLPSAVTISGLMTSSAHVATGIAGATAASRYVGAIASSNGGPLGANPFVVGDWCVNQAGSIYVCTVAGSPGTWVGMYSDGNPPETLLHTQTASPPASPAAGFGVTFMNAGQLLFKDSAGLVTEISTVTPTSNRNAIRNGDMSIWQRGTGAVTLTGFTADGWAKSNTGGTHTVSRLAATPGDLCSGTGMLRSVVSGQSVSTDMANIVSRIEGVQTFEGKTVTISFLAVASAGTPKIGVNMNQFFGSSGTTGLSYPVGAVTISTTLTRYSISFAVPSTTGKTISGGDDNLFLRLWLSAGATYNTDASSIGIQNVTIDITDVQVEAGGIATPFEVLPPHMQLAWCQRYYYRITALTAAHFVCAFVYTTATGGYGMLPFPVTMRAAPISAISHTTGATILASGGPYTCTTWGGSSAGPEMARISVTTGVSAIDHGGYCYLNAIGKWIDFSAEL
jgi:hypothetical protein